MAVLQIRDATLADAEAAGRVVLDAYGTLPEFTPGGSYDAALLDIAARLPPNADVLVAELDGRIVGCVTYVPGPDSPLAQACRPDEAGIRMLGVDGAAQGHGVGRRLVQACLDRAAVQGRAAVFLYSTSYMRTAHRLYLGLGFERVADRDYQLSADVSLLAFRHRLT